MLASIDLASKTSFNIQIMEIKIMELETINYLKFLLALLFVIGLIGGFAILAKRAGLGNRGPMVRGKSKRLSIIETMSLDPKRRIVLVRRDNCEHLILIGTSSEQVIEHDIDQYNIPNEKLNKPSFLNSIENPQKLAG